MAPVVAQPPQKGVRWKNEPGAEIEDNDDEEVSIIRPGFTTYVNLTHACSSLYSLTLCWQPVILFIRGVYSFTAYSSS